MEPLFKTLHILKLDVQDMYKHSILKLYHKLMNKHLPDFYNSFSPYNNIVSKAYVAYQSRSPCQVRSQMTLAWGTCLAWYANDFGMVRERQQHGRPDAFGPCQHRSPERLQHGLWVIGHRTSTYRSTWPPPFKQEV